MFSVVVIVITITEIYRMPKIAYGIFPTMFYNFLWRKLAKHINRLWGALQQTEKSIIIIIFILSLIDPKAKKLQQICLNLAKIVTFFLYMANFYLQKICQTNNWHIEEGIIIMFSSDIFTFILNTKNCFVSSSDS